MAITVGLATAAARDPELRAAFEENTHPGRLVPSTTN
jgi:hypothetical protein